MEILRRLKILPREKPRVREVWPTIRQFEKERLMMEVVALPPTSKALFVSWPDSKVWAVDRFQNLEKEEVKYLLSRSSEIGTEGLIIYHFGRISPGDGSYRTEALSDICYLQRQDIDLPLPEKEFSNYQISRLYPYRDQKELDEAIDLLARFYSRSFGGLDQDSAADIEKRRAALEPYRAVFSQPGFDFRVLKDSEGEAKAILGTWTKEGVTCLSSLAVDPNFRRKGLGRYLVLKVMEEVKIETFGYYVEAEVENEASLRLFENLGFRRVWEGAGISIKRTKITPVRQKIPPEGLL